MKTEILGIQFDNLTREEAARRGAELLEEDRFHYVVTPNPEFILAAEGDGEFRAVLNGADLVLPPASWGGPYRGGCPALSLPRICSPA